MNPGKEERIRGAKEDRRSLDGESRRFRLR